MARRALDTTGLVYGVGLNDLKGVRDPNVKAAHSSWQNMLTRCYSEVEHARNPNYIGYTVAPEWHTLSHFLKWFTKNYVQGYCLDKDILVPGNKEYGPKTCAFVPSYVNKILCSARRARGKLPQGVYYMKATNRYIARCSVDGSGSSSESWLGSYETPAEASRVYQKAKAKHLAAKAREWYANGVIGRRVLSAFLMRARTYNFE